MEFELNVKAGKDSDRWQSGWTFKIKGSPEAGLWSDQSIQVLESWARVNDYDIKRGRLEVEGMGAPACWLARSIESYSEERSFLC